MKKLLVVLLTLALCVTTLASCDFFGNLFGEKEPEVVYDVDAAANYVYNLYKNKSVTAADFEVTAVAAIAGVKHTVEWSVNTDKVKIEKKNDTTYIVNVDEESPEELAYVLTATVKGGDKTATKTFNLTVPKYELTSFEAYMAAQQGDNVVVKGIVVAINSKEAGNKYNHLFLADLNGKGGYYCYSMTSDPVTDGIELGMTVEVSGPVEPYSGMQEIKGGTARIVDTTKKTVDVLDITDKVVNGENLANYVGLPVTIKGVEIKGQELEKETSQYLNFKVGEKTAYVRTYITDFPTTLPTDKKAEIDAAHAEHFGWKANATGILVLYSGNPYLIPMGTDCFEYIEKIEKTPEQKVAEALENLTLPSFISENTTLELPAASTIHTDVAFAWSVANDGYSIADNKIALTVGEKAVELKFTATATCGDKTGTKEITVKVALPEMTIEEAVKLDDGATVVLVGVVTGIKDAWSDQYKNISVYLKDATGELLLYRLSTNVKVGDVIKVTGKMGSYSGNKQLAQGATAEILTVSTSAEATAAEDGTAVVLAGKVTNIAEKDVWSTQYKNMSVTITDAAGTYYLYRISTQVELGDEIVVIGKVGSYKGAKQIAQGSTTIITKKAEVEEDKNEEENGTDTPAADAKVISFADKANRTEYSTEKQVWVQNGITVTNEKAASTSNVGDYANPARFYKSSSLTIACNGMTKIEINVKGVEAAKVSAWLTVTGATATQEGDIVTIVFDAPVNSFTYAELGAQVRANSFTVYTQG